MHFNLSGRRRDGATTAGSDPVPLPHFPRSVVRGFRLLADDRKLFLPSKSENAFENRPGKRSRLKLRSREKKLSGWRPRKESREVN